LRACPVAVRIRPWSPNRLVAQLADAARSDRADRGSNPREPTIPAWRNWLTQSAQTRRNAPGSRPVHCGFESHRWDHSGGDIVEGKDTALSARKYGLRSDSRSARVAPFLLADARSPSPVVLVRMGSSFNGRIPGLHPGDEGSIPASASAAGSFNGRTAVLRAAHGGSIPSPATSSMVSVR
jgi:hypothetical protein